MTKVLNEWRRVKIFLLKRKVVSLYIRGLREIVLIKLAIDREEANFS